MPLFRAFSDLEMGVMLCPLDYPAIMCRLVLTVYSLTICTTRLFLLDYDCLIGLMRYLDT